jgi:hypothetical protein
VLLALKNMDGETTEAWRAVLDDLVSRGLRRPAFLILDGALQHANATSKALACAVIVGSLRISVGGPVPSINQAPRLVRRSAGR